MGNGASEWDCPGPVLAAAARAVVRAVEELAGCVSLADPAVAREIARRALVAAARVYPGRWRHDLPQGWPEHDHEFRPDEVYWSRFDPTVWISHCVTCGAAGVASRVPASTGGADGDVSGSPGVEDAVAAGDPWAPGREPRAQDPREREFGGYDLQVSQSELREAVDELIFDTWLREERT